ncbi:MAG: ATP-binding protein [Geobacteraceae bacterium]
MNPFTIRITPKDKFCNRRAEIETLKKNMYAGIHTVVYAPRRYGKSSLARIVTGELDGAMTGIYIDLFSVTSSTDAVQKIYRGIIAALGAKAADRSSFAQKASAIFKKIRLSLEFNPMTTAPEFGLSLGDQSAEIHLEQVIANLDEYCGSQGMKVCLVLDEFQEICNLKDAKMVEGLLREGMQSAQHVSFLMMGSRRTLLRDMFEDKRRPFYKSAYVLKLSPLPCEEFAEFLQERFAGADVPISREEADAIIDFTDGYPFYTQKLAMLYYELKQAGEPLAQAKQQLLEMESADFENIFVTLTTHQKQLLKAVAAARPKNIHAVSFLAEQKLGSQGGIQSSLKKLLALDLIENTEIGWRVTDPIFERWLRV